jgi:hypothetical protein
MKFRITHIGWSLQSHEEYRDLEKALEAMVDVAQYINEVKRDSDTLQIMRDIQVKQTAWLLYIILIYILGISWRCTMHNFVLRTIK